MAGISIDLVLYPIDSIKTRLQASHQKVNIRSMNSMYKGLASSMTASFPCSAMFMFSYEYSKYFIHTNADCYLNIHV